MVKTAGRFCLNKFQFVKLKLNIQKLKQITINNVSVKHCIWCGRSTVVVLSVKVFTFSMEFFTQYVYFCLVILYFY